MCCVQPESRASSESLVERYLKCNVHCKNKSSPAASVFVHGRAKTHLLFSLKSFTFSFKDRAPPKTKLMKTKLSPPEVVWKKQACQSNLSIVSEPYLAVTIFLGV